MNKLKFNTDPNNLTKKNSDENEKKLDKWMDGAIGESKIKTETKNKEIGQKRIDQHRKIIYVDDELNNAWFEYQNTYRKKFNKKITWQSFIEKYLRRELSSFLNN